jgi:mannose-6-phosphate isomerase-like protein (cupin superfamily)
MRNIGRRAFLGSAMAAFPSALIAQASKPTTQVRIARVPAGEDRFREHRTIGVSSTAFKVSTQDTSGGLFIMEQSIRKMGGPPLHLHHNEDEWFYAVEGEFVVQVGSERFRLKSGDSILGPREVPHTWTFAGVPPGKLLVVFAPANKMEAFFRLKRPSGDAYRNDPEIYRAYGLELLGPPISAK